MLIDGPIGRSRQNVYSALACDAIEAHYPGNSNRVQGKKRIVLIAARAENMVDYDLITLVIAVVALIASLVSLGLLIALYRLALPKVEVHAGFSGQNPSPPGLDEGEFWLELTAWNRRPRQVTIEGFYAILRKRKPFTSPTSIWGSKELAELSSPLPCKLGETEMAKQMTLLRGSVIDESDSRQIEYFIAIDSRGQSWHSRRWPLQHLLGWPDNYEQRRLTEAAETPSAPRGVACNGFRDRSAYQ